MKHLQPARTRRPSGLRSVDRPKILVNWPGGVFADVQWKKDFHVLLSFAELGYDPVLVVAKYAARNRPPGLRIYEMGDYDRCRASSKLLNSICNLYYRFLDSTKLFKILSTERPDVYYQVHITPFLSMASFLHRVTNRRMKLVLKLDANPDKLRRWVSKPLWHPSRIRRYALLFVSFFPYDVIIAETPCSYNALLRVCLPFPGKFRLLPNGYDPSIRPPGGDAKRQKVVLSVARISRQKGLDVLIRAFAEAHRDFAEWRLRIVGPVDDGGLLEDLRGLAASLGVASSVDFVGPFYGQVLKEEYSRASIFALLSNWESFGIARVEAMAYGLPVVTTEAGCGSWLSECGASVVPIGDWRAAAEALKKLMADPNLRSETSSRKCAALLSWDEFARKLEGILEG